MNRVLVYISQINGDVIKHVTFDSYDYAWSTGIDQELHGLMGQYHTNTYLVDIAMIMLPELALVPWLTCQWTTRSFVDASFGYKHHLDHKVWHQSKMIRDQNNRHAVSDDHRLWKHYCHDPTEENFQMYKRAVLQRRAKITPLMIAPSLAKMA